MPRMIYRTPAAKASADANRRRNSSKARAAGLLNRCGIPHGSTRPLAEAARRNAQSEAEWLLPLLAPEWEDPQAKEALGVAIEIARDTSARLAVCLSACRVVLAWTLPPAAGGRLPAGAKAAAWLESVVQAAKTQRGG